MQLTSFPSDPAPWLTIARNELDVRETPGANHTTRILEYHAATRHVPDNISDETPWCASFACWCLEQAGIVSPRRRTARSFLQWGKPLEIPRVGCVVVLDRPPTPWNGHVGFLVRRTPRNVWLLAGNQGDRVGVRPFPLERVLAYRWPPLSSGP